MSTLDNILDRSIIMDGNISFSVHNFQINAKDIANSYIQLLATTSTYNLVTLISNLDYIAFTKNGEHSSPYHDYFNTNISLLEQISKKFIELNKTYSILVPIEDNKLMYFIIPIIFNDEIIGCQIMGRFMIGEKSLISSENQNVFEFSAINKIFNTICENGSIILRRALYNFDKDNPLNNQSDYYKSSIIKNGQYYDYIENIYSNYFEYDFVSGFWNCSKTITKILGLTENYKQDFSGLINLISLDNRNTAYKYFTNIIKSNIENIEYDLSIIRPIDQEKRWIRIQCSFISDSYGEKVKAFGVIHDISSYQITLNQLKNQIEERTKLMSIIGHDLKNPFNALLGFSDLTERALREKRFSDAGEYIKIMKGSASQGYDLLVNLLDYSKSMTGKIVKNSVDFDLYDAIESAMYLYQPTAETKHIKIINKIDLNTDIHADPAMIAAILRNLLSNAVKFCYENGSIIIDFEIINNNTKRISISDTGIQIPQEKIYNILNTNNIESTRGTNGEPGTNLGLKLCKNFLNLHNSKLNIESSKELTKFWFDITE
ncbi:MAG: HAMP domain-containing histidine kinase [Bacteroidales bacterium]|nr:HAMP domain-containing histidine kinase [Bacteroidales bacterium]